MHRLRAKDVALRPCRRPMTHRRRWSPGDSGEASSLDPSWSPTGASNIGAKRFAKARRGLARRGEARLGEARRGEARLGEARRGEARRANGRCGEPSGARGEPLIHWHDDSTWHKRHVRAPPTETHERVCVHGVYYAQIARRAKRTQGYLDDIDAGLHDRQRK